MSSGRYVHQFRIRVPTTADDGEGGQAVTWSNGGDIFGRLRPASAREQAIAGSIQTIATHVLETHYDSRLSVQRRLQRLSPTGAELVIVGVRDEDGRQRDLLVDCAEVV